MVNKCDDTATDTDFLSRETVNGTTAAVSDISPGNCDLHILRVRGAQQRAAAARGPPRRRRRRGGGRGGGAAGGGAHSQAALPQRGRARARQPLPLVGGRYPPAALLGFQRRRARQRPTRSHRRFRRRWGTEELAARDAERGRHVRAAGRRRHQHVGGRGAAAVRHFPQRRGRRRPGAAAARQPRALLRHAAPRLPAAQRAVGVHRAQRHGSGLRRQRHQRAGSLGGGQRHSDRLHGALPAARAAAACGGVAGVRQRQPGPLPGLRRLPRPAAGRLPERCWKFNTSSRCSWRGTAYWGHVKHQ